jgi:hypothetical protein
MATFKSHVFPLSQTFVTACLLLNAAGIRSDFLALFQESTCREQTSTRRYALLRRLATFQAIHAGKCITGDAAYSFEHFRSFPNSVYVESPALIRIDPD